MIVGESVGNHEHVNLLVLVLAMVILARNIGVHADCTSQAKHPQMHTSVGIGIGDTSASKAQMFHVGSSLLQNLWKIMDSDL